jgi:hypothetical protein
MTVLLAVAGFWKMIWVTNSVCCGGLKKNKFHNSACGFVEKYARVTASSGGFVEKKA